MKVSNLRTFYSSENTPSSSGSPLSSCATRIEIWSMGTLARETGAETCMPEPNSCSKSRLPMLHRIIFQWGLEVDFRRGLNQGKAKRAGERSIRSEGCDLGSKKLVIDCYQLRTSNWNLACAALFISGYESRTLGRWRRPPWLLTTHALEVR